MAANNQNNFLRFSGSSSKRDYSINGGFTAWNFFANQDSIVIQPLIGSSASLGINSYSFKIIKVFDPITGFPTPLSQDFQYDGIGNLTVYRLTDPLISVIDIEFQISDNSGNTISNGLIEIDYSSIVTKWIAYPISAVCTLDGFGNNTGYLSWTQLQLVNASTSTPIIPLTLKSNGIFDADYVAPITDFITCPSNYVGSTGYAPLTISNQSLNGANPQQDFINITNIYLYNATSGVGSTPVTLNKPCLIPPNKSQAFSIPAGIPWDITISFNVNPGGDMVLATYIIHWKTLVAGVVSDLGGSSNPVTNTSPVGPNTLTLTFPLGLTIFCS